MYGKCTVHVWCMYGTCTTSYVLRPKSYVLRPTSYVLRPMSYVLRPTSYVLRPTSYVLRPTSHVPCPTCCTRMLVLYQDVVIPYLLFVTEKRLLEPGPVTLPPAGQRSQQKTSLEKPTGLRFAILPPAGQRSQTKTSLEEQKRIYVIA